MLLDEEARKKASDPTASYIVQAPAGSGKTELLTQRYLRLLARVSQPEEIVAITFTRKAASEMRARILKALHLAALDTPTQSSHQARTQEYAKAALNQDQKLNWQLLEQAHRLRIMTIDALCQSIAQAIPLLEQHISFAHIAERPDQNYRRAARACLDYLESDERFRSPLHTLLQHLDNRRDKLIYLLCALLANRPQWLQTLMQLKHQTRESLEAHLLHIETHELNRFKESIDPIHAETLVSLTRLLANTEAETHSKRQSLRHWLRFDELNREQAQALAQTLLTGSNTIRASFDHHVGLKKANCPADIYAKLKSESQSLLANLALNQECTEALIRIKTLPEPRYSDTEWAVLEALFCVLPLLLAHLQIDFREEQVVDFTHVTEIALDALGDDESPTDLALYLDHSIQHLLVDEFQDTSMAQYHLLSKLVRGFEPQDGRTLFVVGDPMQSIYRFRQAEVGLFLRAKQYGIGQVSLQALELQCNFRSNKNIIEWVNHHFKYIFPTHADIESGAVNFHASIAIHEQGLPSDIMALAYPSKQAEALGIVQLIQNIQNQNPEEHIAILVRARSQLRAIIEALKQQHMPFQGIDIHGLALSPHIQDMYSLTTALLMPAHRLSWLSLLRSPFCGLELTDLLSIASVDKNKSIYSILRHLDNITGLSEEGHLRAAYLYKIMHHALINRQKIALSDWIAHTAEQLHSQALFNAEQKTDLIQFFDLVDQFDQYGQLIDFEEFNEALNHLFAAQSSPANIQIMTIHKSKGLEFDTVIIPSCSSKEAPADTPLIRLLNLPSDDDEVQLISPIKAYHEEHALLYDYIGALDSQKSEYERQRLFYVAATRAKKRLYLFDHQESATQSGFRGLLKQLDFDIQSNTDTSEASELAETQLITPYRLAASFYTQAPPLSYIAKSSQAALSNYSNTARLVGIVTHELLQWLCTYHPQEQDIPWKQYQLKLQSLGLQNQSLDNAFEQIKDMIRRLYACPKGQWLLQAHTEERNEYELLCLQDNELMTRVIDRTFIDQGIRWIIDFKTGHEEAAFESHVAQVQEYARLMRIEETLPIRCGLYYLATNVWKIVPETGGY